MAQAEFKYKNDYAAFLATDFGPQQVVDFIVYALNLPNLKIEDAEAVIAACQRVKDRNQTIRKLGYWYQSQFIIYESMFWFYQKEVYEKSLQSFEKVIKIGLESVDVLGSESQDGSRMGLRTQLILRFPSHYGYPEEFKDLERAQKIKKERLEREYFSKDDCFGDMVKLDLEEAQIYSIKGWRSHFYCQLYLKKDKSSIDYFKNQWEQNKSDVTLAMNYLHALKYNDPSRGNQFAEELEAFINKQGDAEGFTRFARMDLKKYSHINGFDVIPWVIAGRDEPSEQEAKSALHHCDMGLKKIQTMKIGPYQYRNKVFLYETKGWVYSHLMPKTYQNYCQALKNYRQALRLYVQVKNFLKDLQFVLGKYIQITKQVLILFTTPAHFDFSNEFKMNEKTDQIFASFKKMLQIEKTGFPYLKRLKLIFELGEEMSMIKFVDNKVFQDKQSSLADYVVNQSENADDNQGKAKLDRIIKEFKSEAEYLYEILQDKRLKAYYDTFMQTFSDVYSASIKVMQGKYESGAKGKLPVSLTSFLTSIVPLYGEEIIQMSEKLLELAGNETTKKRASDITKLAPTSIKLNALCQSLAIKIINEIRDDITGLQAKMIKGGMKHIEFTGKAIDAVLGCKQKFYSSESSFDVWEMQLGNWHANVLISLVISHDVVAKIKYSTPAVKIDALLGQMNSNKKLFQITFSQRHQVLVPAKFEPEKEKENKREEKIVPVNIENPPVQSSGKVDAGCACQIFCMTQIVYDNGLLNHYSLLSPALRVFGLERTLRNCQKLSSEMIQQIIKTNDPELLMAGIMSVEPI